MILQSYLHGTCPFGVVIRFLQPLIKLFNIIFIMKILLSAYACDPTQGSESGNGWNRAVSNVLNGNEVVCLTTHSPQKIKNINEGIERLNLKNIRFEYVDVPQWVKKAYKYEPGVYLHYMVWQHFAYKRAKEITKDEKFDLIHHVTYGSIHMGSEMWKLNLPFVFGPMGGGQLAPSKFKKYLYKWWRSEVQRKWMRKILLWNPNTQRAIKTASILLATNHETYHLAKRFNPKMLRLYPDTTLPDRFFPDELPERDFSKRELRILWIGRIFAFKGLNLVMDALSKVKVPFKLTIVGQGPLSDRIPGWIEKYNLEGKVDVKGKIPWENVRDAYLNNDILMYCSLRDSSAVQFVEAMALGMPIITLDMHGSRTLIPNDAGIKVKVTDPEETISLLAIAVEYMYEYPEKRQEYSSCAFHHAKYFKESLNSLRINNIYKEVLGKPLVEKAEEDVMSVEV
jgi:glycosyltransferase involved in cell wall biosynthesis